VYGLATGTVTIRRGSTTTSPYGDEVDGQGPIVASGVLVSIQEVNKRVWDAANQVARVVRTYECSVQSDVDLRTGDTLIDEGGQSRVFEVVNASQTGGWAFTADLTVDLKRLDLGAVGG
jgi:hypothetical protein